MQLGVEALATLAIALTASFQIGAGDAHPAGTFFALPERRLVSLGAIAFLSVFSDGDFRPTSDPAGGSVHHCIRRRFAGRNRRSLGRADQREQRERAERDKAGRRRRMAGKRDPSWNRL